MTSVLPLPVGPTTSQQKKPPLSLKCFEFDHEIMQNGITAIYLNLVEEIQALQQWAEHCMTLATTMDVVEQHSDVTAHVQ
jgi:hypothetical protein